jgi:hypothetical protein
VRRAAEEQGHGGEREYSSDALSSPITLAARAKLESVGASKKNAAVPVRLGNDTNESATAPIHVTSA